MSRIWKLPIPISAWVTISTVENLVKVKWPKWELSFEIKEFIKLEQTEKDLTVSILDEWDAFQKGVWWLTRTLLSNMIEWVTKWFVKSLEIIWVWYKFEVVSTSKLILSVGFSHKVEMSTPAWVTVELDPALKNTILIKWIDKQQVWFFAAKVRAVKKPEPYKWKWIRYSWEYVRRKAWKTWGKK